MFFLIEIHNKVTTNHKGLIILNKASARSKINNYLKSNLNKIYTIEKNNVFMEINNNIVRIYKKNLDWILSTFSNNLSSFIKNYQNNKIIFDGIDFYSNSSFHNNLVQNYYKHDIYIGFHTNNPSDAYAYSTNNIALSYIFQLIENSFIILDSWNEIKNAEINTEFGFNSQVWFKILDKSHLEIINNSNKAIYKIHKDAFYNLAKKHFNHKTKKCTASTICSKIIMTIKDKESNIEFID